jgi:hypothetical protein
MEYAWNTEVLNVGGDDHRDITYVNVAAEEILKALLRARRETRR